MQKLNHNYAGWAIIIALIACAAIAQAGIKPHEVVLYWTFEDTTADQAIDTSGREHNGTITDGEYVDGKNGLGLEFNGTSTFIELAHHDDFDLPDGYTIALWAMIEDLPHDHIGLPRKQGSYIIHPSKAGNGYNFQTYIIDGGNKLVHNDVVPFDEWHHLAGTYDGEKGRSWVDANVVVEKAAAGKVVSTPGVSLLWSNDCCPTGRMLDGILDEIVIINRALDEGEMAELMNNGPLAAVESTGKLATRWGSVKSQ
jgi:hypothetical protein